MRVIKKQLTKRTLDMLTELAKKPKPEDAEGNRRSDYELFWGSFGKYLKLGIVEDQANRWEGGATRCNQPGLSADKAVVVTLDHVAPLPSSQADAHRACSIFLTG